VAPVHAASRLGFTLIPAAVSSAVEMVWVFPETVDFPSVTAADWLPADDVQPITVE